MAGGVLSGADLVAFDRDGYLLVRQLFDAEETSILLTYARQDPALAAGAYARRDAAGNETRLALWNHAGDDLYSMFSRSPRIVDRMEGFLGGEVYHYHTKMMLKEPFVGGAWEWHQDYGYWYHNGCLFPLLASCLIAVDQATRDNGCLQVLRGLAPLGAHRSWPRRRADRRRYGEGRSGAQADGPGIYRGRTGGRALFSCQFVAPLGPEPLAPLALVADLLL